MTLAHLETAVPAHHTVEPCGDGMGTVLDALHLENEFQVSGLVALLNELTMVAADEWGNVGLSIFVMQLIKKIKSMPPEMIFSGDTFAKIIDELLASVDPLERLYNTYYKTHIIEHCFPVDTHRRSVQLVINQTLTRGVVAN